MNGCRKCKWVVPIAAVLVGFSGWLYESGVASADETDVRWGVCLLALNTFTLALAAYGAIRGHGERAKA